MSTETKLQLKIFYFCLDLFNFYIRLFLVISRFSNFPFWYPNFNFNFFFILRFLLLFILVFVNFISIN